MKSTEADLQPAPDGTQGTSGKKQNRWPRSRQDNTGVCRRAEFRAVSAWQGFSHTDPKHDRYPYGPRPDEPQGPWSTRVLDPGV